MRDDYKRREAQDMPTVAEEVVMAAGMPQGGIADAARAMAPKSSIAQNTGMNEMMPAAATRAPQRMAEGGIVRMREGGRSSSRIEWVGYFAFARWRSVCLETLMEREACYRPRVRGSLAQAN